ncbi:MAG: hypothetical protein J6N76_08255 [Lachnospiraceae bacterium]|nr:hypothetical protein [Lachnospiraceae bacterium]
MKNEWKDALKEAFYAPEPENKQDFLRKIRQREIGTFELLIQQVRYIRLPVWLVAVAIIFLAVIGAILQTAETRELIPAIMPFFAGISVLETKRSEKYKMSELEIVTRFSLRSVIFARMMILGILYLIILCVTSPVIALSFGGKTVVAAIEILIPYLFTMSVSFELERSTWGRKQEYGSLAVASLVFVFMIWIQSYDPKILQRYLEMIESWGVLIVVLLAMVTIFEQYRTIKSEEEFV